MEFDLEEHWAQCGQWTDLPRSQCHVSLCSCCPADILLLQGIFILVGGVYSSVVEIQESLAQTVPPFSCATKKG